MEASQKLVSSRLVVLWNPGKIKKPRTPRLSSLHLRPLLHTTIIVINSLSKNKQTNKKKLHSRKQQLLQADREYRITHAHLMKENTMRDFFGMPRWKLLVSQYTVPLLWRSPRRCSNPITEKAHLGIIGCMVWIVVCHQWNLVVAINNNLINTSCSSKHWLLSTHATTLSPSEKLAIS